MQPNLVPRDAGATRTPSPAVFPYEQSTDPSPWPATPGAEACPACGGAAVNVQGLLDCQQCSWRNGGAAPGSD